MLQKILINTAANYVLKLVQMVLSVASVPILVSSVGADGYGVLILAGTLLGYFMFFDLGLSSAITKYVAEYDAKEDFETLQKVISTSLVVFGIVGVLVAIVVYCLIEVGVLNLFTIRPSMLEPATRVFSIAACIAIIAWPLLALQGTMRGLQDFVNLNLVTGIGRIIAVSLAIFCALADKPLYVIFVALHFDKLIGILCLPILIRARLPSWRFRFSHVHISTLAMMWGFSGWLMLGQIALLLEYQLDTLLIGLYLPVAAVTTYTVIVYPFRIVQQVSGLAASAIMPAVSARHGTGGEAAIDDFRLKGARVHNTLVAVASITMLICVEPFLRIWMGQQYLEYLWLAQLSCVFQMVGQSNAFLGQVYTGSGRSRKPGIVAIATGIGNLVISLVLLQILGLAGVILGTIIAGALGVVAFVFWCLPDIGINAGQYLVGILIRGQAPIWMAAIPILFVSNRLSDIDNWITLMAAAITISLLLLLVGYLLVLDHLDRDRLTEVFRTSR